jgi:dipeptidase E
VAGPNILTTNDWNVVGLTAFEALGLVPFNVNPHYLETDPAMAPGSETRDTRIAEYYTVRDNPVVGIEEGTMVRVEDGRATVRGTGRTKLFRRGHAPVWVPAGALLPV